MIFILITGFVIAFITPFIFRVACKYAGLILTILLSGILVFFCMQLSEVIDGEKFFFEYSWIPALSINLLFYLDGLSLFFALLISGFGVLIVLYSSSYMKGHSHPDRFFMFLIFFMMSMLGLVLAGNLIGLYIFWELTSISSYLLISFKHENSSSRSAALQALLITVAGGLAMLAGFILLGIAAGTYSIPEILDKHNVIVNSPYYIFIIVLILIGAFTKSAQFPFHFWLPNAMTAPTPVSAYLHSATMVKAGIFIVARFHMVLGETNLWEMLLISIGGFTMVTAAFMALKYTDLKKVLAYTTISALGMIFLMFGIGTPHAVQAALVYILAHALYKGAFFLVAGNLDHKAGSRNIKELSGLLKKMPYTGTVAILASLSMAGVLPFLGFLGKEHIYEAALHVPLYNVVLLTAIILSSALYVSIAIVIGYGLFFGALKSPAAEVEEAPLPMLVAPLIISVFGLLFGLFPQFLTNPLLPISAEEISEGAKGINLSLWHGFSLVFF